MARCKVATPTDKNNKREQIEMSRERKLDGNEAGEVRTQTALFSREWKMDQSR